MGHKAYNAFTGFTLAVYIVAVVVNAIILPTSKEHFDKMCGFKVCWREYFVVVFELGIATAVLSLVYSASVLVWALVGANRKVNRENRGLEPMAPNTRTTTRVDLAKVAGSAIIFILWLATIVLGWVPNNVPLSAGEIGIPSKITSSGERKEGSTRYTMYSTSTNWKPTWVKNVGTPKSGQYRFLEFFWNTMRPVIGTDAEKSFGKEWTPAIHAKQGIALLVINHIALVVSCFALVWAVVQLMSARKARRTLAVPVTKEAHSGRNSSV